MDADTYLLFEDYLDGRLSDEEKRMFEARLTSDAEFQNSFTTYKELNAFGKHTIGKATEREDFRQNIAKVANDYARTEPTTISKIRQLRPWQYAAAATVLVLIAISYFQFFAIPTYDDYREFSPISISVRGTESTSELLQRAQTAYNNENFEAAAVAFTRLRNAGEGSPEILLYNAIALTESDEEETAAELYNELMNGDSVYAEEAIWYAALNRLKQEKHSLAKELLKNVPSTSPYYQKAQKLQKKL
ncbi:hypothetical protein [Luteirhabdus pelagi]|uniref:hypothetical protein n=1 Tax=Luteirhabdus pelagi TaxID=2792783 RepID=UPI00193AAECA|nr:hypothetical protein [Luteirhabdus pelagi]